VLPIRYTVYGYTVYRIYRIYSIDFLKYTVSDNPTHDTMNTHYAIYLEGNEDWNCITCAETKGDWFDERCVFDRAKSCTNSVTWHWSSAT